MPSSAHRLVLLVMTSLALAGSAVLASTAVAASPWYRAGVIGTAPPVRHMSIPHAIDFAADGTIYLTGYNDHVVQHLSADGSTLLDQFGAYGTGPGELDRPVGLAVGPDGSICVTEQNHRVQRFAPDGTALGSFGSFGTGPGQFDQPDGLDFAPDGTLYVADTTNNRIQRFTADGTLLAVIGSLGAGPGQFNSPRDIAVAADGTLYVAEKGNARVQHLAADGSWLASFGAPGVGPGQFGWAEQIDIAADGTLWVADRTNHRVQHFLADGTWLGSFGSTGQAPGQFDSVEAVAIAPDGTIWTSDLFNHRLQHFDSSGALLSVVQPNGAAGVFNEPRSIAAAADGSWVAADKYNHRIQRFAADGTHLWSYGTRGTGNGQLREPLGAAVAADGTVFVADTLNHRIVRVAADGSSQLATIGALGATNGNFNQPTDVAFAPDGSLLVVDRANNRVQRLDSSGIWQANYGGAGVILGKLSGARSIAVDTDGSFWVSEVGTDRVQRFSAAGVGLSTIGTLGTAPGQFTDPSDVAIGPDGSILVSGEFDHRIQRFSPDGTLLDSFGDGAGTEAGPALRPWAVAATGDTVIVANGASHLLERWRIDSTDPVASTRVSYEDGIATVSVEASDSESGLSARAYSFDGGVTFAASPSITRTAAALAQQPVTAIVRDRIGRVTNVSAVGDHTPPSVSRSGSLRTVTVRGQRYLRFALDDVGSGIQRVQARFHGVAVPVFDGRLNLRRLPEGRGTLRLTITDHAGNATEWSESYVIDRSAPTLLRTRPRHVLGGWVSYGVHDGLSGVASPRAGARAPKIGRQLVSVRATDRAGNRAARTVVVIRHAALATPMLNAGLAGSDRFAIHAAFGVADDGPSEGSRALVREVQWRLRRMEFLACPLRLTGALDPITVTAIARYQHRRGLTATGTIDAPTRAALDADFPRLATPSAAGC